jgi:hypothetical protein
MSTINDLLASNDTADTLDVLGLSSGWLNHSVTRKSQTQAF